MLIYTIHILGNVISLVLKLAIVLTNVSHWFGHLVPNWCVQIQRER